MELTQGKLICLGFTTLIILTIGIGGPFLIDSVIKSQVNQQITMTDDNFSLWGEIPGETGVDIVRDIYFYHFKNSRDVIFKNAKPEFQEMGPYQYYEYHNFTAPTYHNDGAEVDFYFKQWFEHGKGTDGNTQMEAINLGPMGAWMQMKGANMQQIASQAFGELILSLKEQMIPSVIGTGITAELFDNTEDTVKHLKKDCGLTEEQAYQVATDPNYGLNAETVYPWALLSYKIDSNYDIQEVEDGEGTFTMLQNYFGLSFEQMSKIKKLIYNGKTLPNIGAETTYNDILKGKGLQSKFVDKPYCKQYKKFPCNSDYLAALQWTIEGVTEGTPKILGQQLPQIESIAYVNHTLIGYPEIRYYFNAAFSNETNTQYFVSNDQNFLDQFNENQNEYWIKWGMEAMETLPGDQYVNNKYPHALLNIGNMKTMIKLGQQYDQETEGKYVANNEYLVKLQKKLNFDNPEKTYIFWNYMKYMVYYFAEMKEFGGNSGTAALGQVVAEGLSTNVNKMADFLLPNLMSQLLQNHFNDTVCARLLQQDPITESQALNACSNYFASNDKPLNQKNFENLLQLCTQQNTYQNAKFTKESGIETKDLVKFCTENTSFSTQLQAYQQEFASKYDCKYKTYCSQFEIAAKQWRASEITNDPIDSLKELPEYKQFLSVSDIYPDEFPAPFEFGWFKEDYKDVLLLNDADGEIFVPNEQQAYELLSYDRLFSGPLMSYGLIEAYAGNDEKVQDLYQWTDSYQFLSYMRYLGLYVGFGGFIQTRSIDELLMGYEDPFLENLASINPQEGGDPSTQTTILLMDPNITTDKEAMQVEWLWGMKTGKDDIQDIRMYTQIADHDYIVLVQDAFDGENIYKEFFNPYAAEVPVYGNDGTSANPAMQKGQDNPVYIYNLYNGKNLTQTGEIKHNGLDCYRYQPSAKDFYNCETNPDNCVFYNNGENGVFNMSGTQGAPIYNSQTHFYQGNETLWKNITVYNTEGKLQGPSKWDETFVDSEIYTGTTLSVVLNLQINYAMEPDILFPQEFTRYLPIYYMYRASNWTDSQASAQFGQLSTGLDIKLGILIGFNILGGLLLILLIVLIVKYRKNLTKVEELEEDEEDDLKQKLVKDSENNNRINNNYSTKITNN